MKSLWLAITALVLLPGIAAACARRDSTAVCSPTGETAVVVYLVDEQNSPLAGVNVSYRVDEGAWHTSETANGEIALGDVAGDYHVRAEKAGYQAAETRVSVPPQEQGFDGPACGVVTQAAQIRLARSLEPEPTCTEATRQLVLEVVSSVAGPLALDARLNTPAPSGSRPLTCEAGDSRCRLAIDLNAFGAYELALAGLPRQAALQVEADVVGYSYDSYQIYLQHGQRQSTLAGAGVGQVTLAFDVVPDESGCPLVDLRRLRHTGAQYAPFADPAHPAEPQLWLQHSLLMTGPNDEPCRQEPTLTPVDFRAELPPGTRLADVAVQYQVNQAGWQTADCRLEEGQYLCTAFLPNPLRGQPLTVKATIAGEETIGLQLPAGGLCLIFR